MTLITASYVAERLAAQAETFARELLPNGKKEGTEWCVGNTDGDAGKSLKVQLQGPHAGQWRDWADGDAHGDLLDLIAVTRHCDISTAINQACQWLNIVRTELHGHVEKTYKKPEPPADRKRLSATTRVQAFFAARRISPETLVEFKVAAKGDDTAIFPFFRAGKPDDLVHIQYRAVAEKKFWASEGTEMILFGWQAMPPRERAVIITEGPMDALAWREYGFHALSVPNGAGGNGKQGKWIEAEFQNMERFDKVYVCMDKDDEGEKATAAIVERLGRHRCFVIHLPDPHKDANDCLMHGVPREIIAEAVATAKTMDPSELRNASYFADDVVAHFSAARRKIEGFTAPWAAVQDITFGFGQTSIIAGWNGSGKTTLIGQLTLEAMRQGHNACVASLEFKTHTYLGWLVRQALCSPNPTEAAIRDAVQRIGERLWAFGAYGSARLDKIIDVWGYAHARYGCKVFVLDNFSKLELGVKSDDTNGAQGAAITRITEFAVTSNSHVIVAAHSRKKLNEYEEVSKLDIKGSGTLTDLVDTVLLLHRNKKKERAMIDRRVFAELDIEEQAKLNQQPDAWLTCDKNRHGDSEPRAGLWFDRESHQYVERERGSPTRYVK